MRAKQLIPLLLLLFSSPAFCLSPEINKAGEELVAALQAQAKDQLAEDDADEARQTKQFIRQVQQALGQDNVRQLKNWLQGMEQYEHSDQVSARFDALKAVVKENEAAKTRETIATLQRTLTEAAETITRAEQPEDLDKLLASLSRNNYNDSGDYESDNRELRNLIQQLSNARQYVNNWQDYLQASNAGNSGKAVQALRNLSNQDTGLLPRSQIIARIAHEQGNDENIHAIAEGVRKPEDMRVALRKLSNLMAASRMEGDNAAVRETHSTLAKMEKAYREYLAGLPVNLDALSSTDAGTSGERPAFVEVRAALLLMMLPRALDLPEGLVPSPGETVDGFLARAISETGRQGNTAASLRAGNVRRLLTRATTDMDMDALRAYAAGQQQLAAGQHALAVSSLQRSLKAGSDTVPAAKAGEMLDSIRKDHPEEYKQGMEDFNNPPPSADPELMRGIQRDIMRHQMMFSDRMYGRDGRPGNTTNLVLPVPAAGDTAPAKDSPPAPPAPPSPAGPTAQPASPPPAPEAPRAPQPPKVENTTE